MPGNLSMCLVYQDVWILPVVFEQKRVACPIWAFGLNLAYDVHNTQNLRLAAV